MQSYQREEWQKGYQSQKQEYDYWIEEIEGEIPQDLQGTLFRNGPGLLDIHGTEIRHPFDGDGMICAIGFKDGRAFFRNRFVRTQAFVEEQAEKKILYRGVFGTQKPGGWLANAFDLRLKNIANTNVIYWGGKLLALWEAAEPYRLNPVTLETIGIDYLDGILESGDAFSAHPWIDFNRGEPCLVNFSLNTGLSSKITLYEFDVQGKLLHHHTHSIPGFAFIHDFAITPNYAIFCQNPVTFNPLPFLFGFKGAGECIEFQAHRPTQIILIPREPPYEDVRVFSIDSGFIFHHANAFQKDNKVYLDSVAYADLPKLNPDISYQEVDFENLAPGQLWRFSLDLETGKAHKQLLESRCCEFPSLNPGKVGRDYRYAFLGATHDSTGNAPLQAIIKIDLQEKQSQLYSFAPQGFVSEPIFVPKTNSKEEDDGWVLTMVYDASRHISKLAILDGRNLDAIAILSLKHHIPYGLHGSWTNECFC